MNFSFKKFGSMLMTVTLGIAVLFSGSAIIAPQQAEAAYSASKAKAIIATGNKYLGRPYVFGASTKTTKAFDCSSFVKHVYKRHGITLPRTSKAQAKQGTYVAKKNLKVGDLVFFNTSSRNGKGVDHVAIYAGNGKILHTYKKGVGVTYSKLNSKYWKDRYVTARRVIR